MARQKRSKGKGTWRYILIALGLLLAIGLIALILIMSTGSDFREALLDLRGKAATTFYYEGAASGGAVPVGSGLACVNSSGVTLYNRRGEELWSQRQGFRNPRFSLAEGWAAAWDFGGKTVYLLKEDGLAYKVNAEGALRSVTVNDKGYLCLCTKEVGYGGSATVYNPNGTALYKWYSGQSYLLTACMREENDLLLLTLGSEGSKLALVRITEEEPLYEATFSALILDAAFNDRGVTAITGESILFLTGELTQRAACSFSGQALKDYALGENCAALLLGQYQVGGLRTLVTCDIDGHILGNLTMEEEPLSLCLRRDTVCLYTPGTIRVLTRRLTETASLTAPVGCEAVYLRARNQLIAAGPYTASVLSYEREEKS